MYIIYIWKGIDIDTIDIIYRWKGIDIDIIYRRKGIDIDTTLWYMDGNVLILIQYILYNI